MANTIRLKRASGSDPSASDLVTGELAVRTDTAKLFTKKDDNSVAEIGGATVADGSITSAKIANGAIVNVDVNASAAIAGSKIDPDFGSQNVVTTGTLGSGDITITGGQPALKFIDDGANPDYNLYNNNGVLRLYDITNAADRLVVNTDGHIDVKGNLDCEAGLDVTGDISVSGTVDGIDLQTLNTAVSANTAKVSNATHTGDVTGSTALTIANDAVTNAKIANNAVNTSQLVDGSVNTDKLDDNAVTTAKIASGAVTTARLAADAVTGAKIADDSIDSEHYVDGSIDTAHIADDQVTFAKIQNISQNKFAGRISSGTGNLEQLTAANVRSIINVEDGATADQTASEILTLIKTVDGAGSGLDADTLDGISSASFVRGDDTDNGSVSINVQDADFVVADNTDGTSHFIWRDHSASKLYLGTSAAVITPRSSLIPNDDSSFDIGSSSKRYTNGYFDNVYGNGANLTALNASNISSGTISASRIPTLNQDTTGSAATLTTARTIAGVSFDGSANISLNNANITNGAGYITATLTNEQVQDIVGAMVSGNTESGISVTYQDSDGTLDFSVSSQTDNNFTTTLKNKLDGIASGATNVTNNNQLTNGAGYITSADGGNAATLDSIDSSQFARSDTADTLSGLMTFSGGISLGADARCAAGVSSLSDGSTITVNFTSGIHHSVTLGGNRTFGNPSNDANAVGQSGSIFITQDGTGSRTASFHSDYKFAGGTAPTLSTAANAVDRLDYVIKASGVIHCVVSLDVK